MKRSDVKIGGVYIAKVTNRLVEVRIERVSRYGGWEAVNLRTSKPIRVKSAQRLREAVDAKGPRAKNTNGQGRNSEPKTAANAMQAMTPTDQTEVNEPLPQPCPNCGSTQRDEDGDCAKCHEPRSTGKDAKAADTEPPTSKKVTPAKPKHPSGLDAAAKVLEETGVPMNVKEIVEVAFAKGYWKPAGRTPSATLAAALIREIAKKGNQSRFRKSERGKFVRA
jgi:hypothetical protein